MDNAEIAERLQNVYLKSLTSSWKPCLYDQNALRAAAEDERKIAYRELVPLPPPETSDYKGLKVKYRVFKASDNSAVEGCFILRPEKDPAARAALFAYAFITKNQQLSEDILSWLLKLQKKDDET